MAGKLQASLIALGISLCPVSFTVSAQTANFPDKPLHVIVPYGPGGAGDITTRIMGNELTTQWKQPVIVEYKPGASTLVGLQAIATAPRDGYTMMLCSTTLSTNEILYKSLPYKFADITGISLLVRNPYAVVASNSVPGTGAREFVEFVRKNPGKVNFASLGPASPSNFLARAFARANNIDMTEIPYKGTGQVTPDLVAGTVQFYLDAISTSLPLHRQGRVKLLGIASSERLSVAADVPTMSEQGFPFVYESWFGMCAPNGIPAPVVAKLGEGVRNAVASEEFQSKMKQNGTVPASSPSPQQFTQFLKDDVETWKKIIQPLNISLD